MSRNHYSFFFCGGNKGNKLSHINFLILRYNWTNLYQSKVQGTDTQKKLFPVNIHLTNSVFSSSSASFYRHSFFFFFTNKEVKISWVSRIRYGFFYYYFSNFLHRKLNRTQHHGMLSAPRSSVGQRQPSFRTREKSGVETSVREGETWQLQL